MRAPVLALVLLAACHATPAEAPRATTSAAGATPTDEGSPAHLNGPCLATTAHEIPAGWATAGSLVVAVKAGHPSQLTVKDAAGKLVTSETPVEESKIRRQITDLACRADAWLAVPGAGPASEKADGEVTFTLARPTKSDAAADAALLCTMPKEANDPSADDAQRAITAAAVYSERLSSVRYRSWFYAMDRELGAAQSDSDRVGVKQSHAEKLAALLRADRASPERCWFAKVLAASKR